LTELLRSTREKVQGSDYRENPWSPGNAPKLSLR
jgi:hypothetical protein